MITTCAHAFPKFPMYPPQAPNVFLKMLKTVKVKLGF